jgi:hypothetical protein
MMMRILTGSHLPCSKHGATPLGWIGSRKAKITLNWNLWLAIIPSWESSSSRFGDLLLDRGRNAVAGNRNNRIIRQTTANNRGSMG